MAFVVEKWRNGAKIGEIVREMQIIVIDSPNNRPKLDSIPDLCVEAGTLIQQTIRATDRNGDPLALTSIGGCTLMNWFQPKTPSLWPCSSPPGRPRGYSDGTQSIILSADSVYCYKIETVGSYNLSRTQPVLYNLSQVLCVNPVDTIRPCAPLLKLDTLDCSTLAPDAYCNQQTFTNELTWIYPAQNTQGATCDPRIMEYRIYYARYQDEQPAFLASRLTTLQSSGNSFSHTGLTSFAGCYYVTAVNRFGMESAPSNTVCKDNCPRLTLPNVFTPNNDGKNDAFTPLNCPTFVQTTELRVFNR